MNPQSDLQQYDDDEPDSRPKLRALEGGGDTSDPVRGHLSSAPDTTGSTTGEGGAPQSNLRALDGGGESSAPTGNLQAVKDGEENPSDSRGSSSAEDINERLGKGYTSKDGKKHGPSKFYSSSSAFKKKIAIAGAAAGGSIVVAVLIFLALLPLKIASIINNIDGTFGAASDSAMQQTTNNMVSDWVRDSLLPALNTGTCKRTIDPGCVPVASGTGPIGKVYAAWNKNRLDKKLATDYGIIVGRGSDGRPYMNVNGRSIDLSELQSGEKSLFNLPGTTGTNSREILAQINNGLEGETKWKQVYKRYFITKKIDKTLGTYTHCLVVCDTREKVSLSIKQAKLGAQLWTINRVLGGRAASFGVVASCMLTPENCSTDISPDSNLREGEDGPVRSKVQQLVDSQLESYLENHTVNDLAKLTNISDEINKSGNFSGYAVKLGAQQLANAIGGEGAKEVVGQAVDKAVPIYGWIKLGLGVAASAATLPKVIQYVSYASNSRAAAQEYTTYKTAADELQSGNTDASAYGSLVTALSASSTMGQTHSDMTASPLYNSVMSGSGTTFANPASILAVDNSVSGGAYLCNNGKPVPAGRQDCIEDDFSATKIETANAISNNPAVQTIGGASGAILKILDVPGQFIGGAVSALCVGPCKAALAAAGSVASNFLTSIVSNASLNPFQDMSGGRTINMIIGGGDVTHNAACYQTLGCAKQSNAVVTAIRTQQLAADKEAFDSQSVFARMFSTATPYSFVSRLAVAMPANVSTGLADGVSTITSNPFGSITNTFSSMFSTRQASAASVDDPFGVTQMAYTSSQIPAHPGAFWEQNCAIADSPYGVYDDTTNTFDATAWYNNPAYQQQDPNTGQQEATQPNPCMLIQATFTSVGGLSDASLLPEDGTGSGADPITSPPTGSGTLPTGTTQELAKELDGGNVTFQTKQDADYFSEIEQTGKATSCGDPTISPRLLATLIVLSKQYKLVLGVFTDGHNCSDDVHSKGLAVDINGINPLTGSGGTGNFIRWTPAEIPILSQFYEDAAKILGANGGGGLGQVQCYAKAGSSPPAKVSGVTFFNDTCDHLHMDVGTNH